LSEGHPEGFDRIFELEKDKKYGIYTEKKFKNLMNRKYLHMKKTHHIYTEKQFKNLTNLRYLHMKMTHLNGDFKDLMKGLKWLSLTNCSMNFEVNNFPVKELAVLQLQYSDINEKWKGWSFFMVRTKVFFLFSFTFMLSFES